MVLFNYSTKELTAKIVYYGPGLCGKTTNLQYIHQNLPETVKGKMLSLATKTDRTLFFDFLPIDLGEIRGMQTRVQLYTVPGQVFYNETRKLVLKGADAIVFVADSQEQMLKANVESFRNLEENLKEQGLSLAEMPHVIQFNKRDLPKLASITDMNTEINKHNAPFYETVATTGIGVQDSLKAITKLVLLHLTQKYEPRTAKPAPRPKAKVKPAPVAAPTSTPTPKPMPPIPELGDTTTAIPLAATSVQTPPVRANMEANTEKLGAPIPIVTETPPTAPTPEPAVDTSRFFADSEIDDLMDDVQEVEIQTMAPLDGASPEPVAGDTDPQSQAKDLGIELTLPEADIAESAAVNMEDLETELSLNPEEPAAQKMETEHFVLDMPDSDEESSAETITEETVQEPERIEAQPMVELERSIQSIDVPSEETPAPVRIETEPDTSEPQSVPVMMASERPEEEDEPQTVFLTEPASNDDLFTSDDMEVAKLAAGEEQEILVPVEIGDETVGLKKFKLSIKLRLDPLD
jgi:signal recognition particle receptor subunit beta